MRFMNSIISSWSSGLEDKEAASWLRKGLYVVVLYNIIFLAFPLRDLLWGEHSLIAPMSFPELWTNRFIMFLHYEGQGFLYPFFMGLPLIGVVIFWRWKKARFASLLVYLGTVILFNRTYTYLTGGNYLLHVLLFYLIWIDENGGYSGWKGALSNIVSNFGLWACRIQVVIVYLFTGLYKMSGESWPAGEAVYIITHVDEFTLPWFEHSIAEIHWLMVIANYSALIYFFSFPFLVWSKKYKLYLLSFGVIFHLTLAFLIGVFDFSLVMIVSYAAFLDSESIEKIKALLPSKKRSLAHP